MKRMIITLCILVLVILLIAGAAFYATQEKMIFYPDYIHPDTTYSFNGEFEEVYLSSQESKINAVHFKAKNPKGVILYFHGNAGSLDSWGTLGEDFIKINYDFFIFDYRGYGKSTGPKSEKAFHEDGQMAYDHLKKKYKEEEIVLYGRSLGSGFATKVAMNNNPKALILETPYYNFITVGKHHFPFLPISLILRWTIRTDHWIGKVKSPILIFHGTKDEIIPYQQSIKLQGLLKKEDTFVTIPEGTHNNLTTYPEYVLFMQKYLK